MEVFASRLELLACLLSRADFDLARPDIHAITGIQVGESDPFQVELSQVGIRLGAGPVQDKCAFVTNHLKLAFLEHQSCILVHTYSVLVAQVVYRSQRTSEPAADEEVLINEPLIADEAQAHPNILLANSLL